MFRELVLVVCFALVFGLVATAVGVETATNPNPPNGAIDVPLNAILSWTPGDHAIEHHVFFGDTYPPMFRGSQTVTSYDPGPLTACTGYFWRIDEVDDQFNYWQGQDWTFTTICAPDPNSGTCWDPLECAGQPKGDATCDGDIDLADLFALKQHFGKCAPWAPSECCPDFDHSGCINLADLFTLKQFFGSGPYAPATGNQSCP
ncbi:MAG: hypothetical protein ACYTEL_11095 [Planctomycetota bacterium]|jgi:hypothetical protein